MSENKIQISEKYRNDVKGLTHDKLILVPLFRLMTNGIIIVEHILDINYVLYC